MPQDKRRDFHTTAKLGIFLLFSGNFRNRAILYRVHAKAIRLIPRDSRFPSTGTDRKWSPCRARQATVGSRGRSRCRRLFLMDILHDRCHNDLPYSYSPQYLQRPDNQFRSTWIPLQGHLWPVGYHLLHALSAPAVWQFRRYAWPTARRDYSPRN